MSQSFDDYSGGPDAWAIKPEFCYKCTSVAIQVDKDSPLGKDLIQDNAYWKDRMLTEINHGVKEANKILSEKYCEAER